MEVAAEGAESAEAEEGVERDEEAEEEVVAAENQEAQQEQRDEWEERQEEDESPLYPTQIRPTRTVLHLDTRDWCRMRKLPTLMQKSQIYRT